MAAYTEDGCGPIASQIRGARRRTVADLKRVRDNHNIGQKRAVPNEKFPDAFRQNPGTPRMG